MRKTKQNKTKLGVLGKAVLYELHTQASAQLSSLHRQPQAPWLIS